jgi:hypothetical protein
MADYSILMGLEKKAKAVPLPVPPVTDAPALPANQQASKEANQQISKPANHQGTKPVSEQASKVVKQHASKEANQKTSKLANQQTTKEKKKYGTYLTEESIASIQMLAIQTKRKDHEVLQDIIDTFFAKRSN